MKKKMCWHELKKKELAPQMGMALIYTRQRVLWKEYKTLAEIEEWLKEEELLEIHLFDDNKEYRALATQSCRFTDGFLENCFDYSEEKEENIYQEKICLEDGGTLVVKNHLSYNKENGMAIVDGYQLVRYERGK